MNGFNKILLLLAVILLFMISRPVFRRNFNRNSELGLEKNRAIIQSGLKEFIKDANESDSIIFTNKTNAEQFISLN